MSLRCCYIHVYTPFPFLHGNLHIKTNLRSQKLSCFSGRRAFKLNLKYHNKTWLRENTLFCLIILLSIFLQTHWKGKLDGLCTIYCFTFDFRTFLLTIIIIRWYCRIIIIKHCFQYEISERYIKNIDAIMINSLSNVLESVLDVFWRNVLYCLEKKLPAVEDQLPLITNCRTYM